MSLLLLFSYGETGLGQPFINNIDLTLVEPEPISLTLSQYGPIDVNILTPPTIATSVVAEAFAYLSLTTPSSINLILVTNSIFTSGYDFGTGTFGAAGAYFGALTQVSPAYINLTLVVPGPLLFIV